MTTLNLDKLITLVENADDLRKEILTELRSIYDTENYEGVDCPHDGESVLLDSIGAKYPTFEECSFIELLDVVEALRTWTDVFNP